MAEVDDAIPGSGEANDIGRTSMDAEPLPWLWSETFTTEATNKDINSKALKFET